MSITIRRSIGIRDSYIFLAFNREYLVGARWLGIGCASSTKTQPISGSVRLDHRGWRPAEAGDSDRPPRNQLRW